VEEKSILDNPFVGLRTYESHEAPLFFGREDLTKELLRRLRRTHFVAVVGSSGSGKSSLIRAGLIPELTAGFLSQERDQWKIMTLKPGDYPLRSLADSVIAVTGPEADETKDMVLEDIERTGLDAVTRRLHPVLEDDPSNLLVLVDQFEELFTHGPTGQSEKAEHRDQVIDFISIMLDLAKFENLPIYVVMTMRSDYIGECDAYSGLAEAINRSQYLVPRLNRRQRRAVIEGPVRLFGTQITEDLVGSLLIEIRDDNDQLPVLQYALMRTWSFWKAEGGKGPVDVDSYNQAGRIAQAIEKDAEQAYKAVKELGLGNLAKRIFQALTRLDVNNRAVRSPLRLDELQVITEGKDVAIKQVIERFCEEGRSFLMCSKSSNPLIDISHESLIRQWHRLNDWVEEEASAAESYRTLERAAKNWKRTGSKDDLLTGYDLEQAVNWQKQGYFKSAWATRYETAFGLAIRCLEESKNALSKKRVAKFAFIASIFVIVILLIGGGFIFVDRMYWNRLRTANEFLAERKYEEAIESCGDAIFWNDDHHGVFLAKGMALSLTKKYKEAITVFKEGIEIEPKYYSLHLQIGNAYLKKKPSEEKEALKHYKEAIKLSPAIIEESVYKFVVTSLLYSKNGKEEIKDIRYAIDVAPYLVHFDFYDKVIIALTKEGKEEEAKEYANKREEVKKTREFTEHKKNAYKFIEEREFRKASEEFKEAYKLDPEKFNTDDHNAMGIALLETGEVADAKKHFDKAIENEPEEAGIYVYKILGYGLLKKKKIDEAIEPLKKALTLMRKSSSQSSESDIDDFKSEIETGLKDRGQEEKQIRELLRKVGFDV
jgi:tetratricopeptide (TPR) repeat protein